MITCELTTSLREFSSATIFGSFEELRALPVFLFKYELANFSACLTERPEEIIKFIQNGESVVLLCLGDTSLFSSSSNILRIIKHNYPEIITKTIPGISSLSAAAALNDFDLVKKGETLIIKECPSSKLELTSLIRESKGNKIVLAIMKVGKRWKLVREALQKEGINNKSLIALNIGMPNQIIQYASQYKKEFMPYFSLF